MEITQMHEWSDLSNHMSVDYQSSDENKNFVPYSDY